MEAKGKGILETYWLHPKHSPFTASIAASSVDMPRTSDGMVGFGNQSDDDLELSRSLGEVTGSLSQSDEAGRVDDLSV